jgi:hypothetical protein
VLTTSDQNGIYRINRGGEQTLESQGRDNKYVEHTIDLIHKTLSLFYAFLSARFEKATNSIQLL